ncbi:TPA: serine acetyltransferase [Clostridium perfringens]|uniref:serine O-acetyltransferase n=1 Tax=Clostridium perfringens TaxID=1502 RepID=UPI001A2D04FF|nr:serine acetyltransferase [Clostridium perfringens]
MIKSKEEYFLYLSEDKKSLGENLKRCGIFKHEIWKYQILLRKCEYINNCKGVLYKPYLLYLQYRRNKLGTKLGFSIPINVFGPGLSIAHRGTIVVNSKARIGCNCRIHVCTNIGTQLNGDKAPIIGNNVYIGPGAKIFGDIKIADGVAIGANSVVNKSFYEKYITIAGVPARKIGDRK